eukprot:SAG31_NODE_505_length_14757_cov_20.172943_3_plen_77_part_00
MRRVINLIDLQVTRREYIMRNRYPYGVVGIDAPVEGTAVYADKFKKIQRERGVHLKHSIGRRMSALRKSILSRCTT